MGALAGAALSRAGEALAESEDFLSRQLITYLGNKRNLLDFIGSGVQLVKERLGKGRLRSFDVFSGSGVVSRFLKRHSEALFANDLEDYAAAINECYLTNRECFDDASFREVYSELSWRLEHEPLARGFIAEMYAPSDEREIKGGERAFYTQRNARYLDTARQLIDGAPEKFRKYLIAPLLSEASIHANTSGVFKGFYKDPATGLGRFGGRNQDALLRILGDIRLPYPVFSEFSCDYRVYCGDANAVCEEVPEVDLAYLDPPYNQHPYGSNYFMLNAILDYEPPRSVSPVSGIPSGWKRSKYNQARSALSSLSELIGKLRAKFVLVSFNSEGFISSEEMSRTLVQYGKLRVLETRYNTFRGSRNLSKRALHVKEFLYLLEKDEAYSAR